MPTNFQDMSSLSSPQLEDSIKSDRISKAVLPLGSFEQHGPHLPLNTDTTISEYVARRVSERCPKTSLLPTIPFGCSTEHFGFTGTMSLEHETLSRIILETAASLRASGLRKMFIINGHGGNRATLEMAIVSSKRTLPSVDLYAFTIIDIVKEKFAQVRHSGRRLVGHADEIETSMMLAIRPEAVDMSKATLTEPRLPSPLSFEPEDLARTSFAWNARDLSRTGVIGDPRHATAETGRVLADFVVEKISSTINEL